MNEISTSETESNNLSSNITDAIHNSLETPKAETTLAKQVEVPTHATTQTQTNSIKKSLGNDDEKLNMLMDVNLVVTVELGRTDLTIREVLDLQRGSVVELDRMAGDPVDILINDHLFAHGEVVVVDDKFGVRITEIVTSSKCSV